MDIETLRALCASLHGTTEDIKWESDLCFLIGEKMYCITGFGEPYRVAFKVVEDEFDDLVNRNGVIPAPYLARYKWVSVREPEELSRREWEHYITNSYELVKAKLPKNVRKKHGL